MFDKRVKKMKVFSVRSKINELKMTGAAKAKLDIAFPEGISGNVGAGGSGVFGGGPRNLQSRGSINVYLPRRKAVEVRQNDWAIVSGKPYWSANDCPSDADWYLIIPVPFRVLDNAKLSRAGGTGVVYLYLKKINVDIQKVDFDID